MNRLCRLNLVFAPAYEDAVTTALIEHEPPLPGFTLLRAEGHSSDFAHATIAERVKGRVNRRVLWMVLDRDEAERVVEGLRAKVRSAAVLWWIEPVEAFGRLA
jgi:hypothetical protein